MQNQWGCWTLAFLFLFAVPLSAHIAIPETSRTLNREGQNAQAPDSASMEPGAPELPQVNIAGLPRETQDQVTEAYAAALKQPQDASAVGKLGMLLDAYHRPEDAALCYRRAHLLAPTEFKWLYYWGSLLLRERKTGEALPILTSALRLEPEYLPARLEMGEALLGAGKTEAAGKNYEAILKDYPDTTEAYYGLGRVKAAFGDQAAAAELYRQACQLFPTYGAAHYGLAVAYRKLGRIQEAEEQANLHGRNNYIVPPLEDPLRDELRALDRSAATHLERGIQLPSSLIRNDNVDFAVVIEVRESAPTMRARCLKILARLSRRVLEGPVSEIRKNAVWLFILRGLKHFHVVVDVRARGEQVFPSVIVQVEEARAPAAALDREGREPRAVSRVFEQAATEVTKKRERLIRQTHDADVRTAVVVVIPEIRPHARDRFPAIRQSHARQDSDFFKGSVAAIMKQEILLVVIRHEDVHKAVIVIIGEGHAHAPAMVLGDPRSLGDIFKRPVSTVAVKRVGEAFEVRRVAINTQVARGITAETIVAR
jgi:tetratricopeptide (TPR) repeat protein